MGFPALWRLCLGPEFRPVRDFGIVVGVHGPAEVSPYLPPMAGNTILDQATMGVRIEVHQTARTTEQQPHFFCHSRINASKKVLARPRYCPAHGQFAITETPNRGFSGSPRTHSSTAPTAGSSLIERDHRCRPHAPMNGNGSSAHSSLATNASCVTPSS